MYINQLNHKRSIYHARREDSRRFPGDSRRAVGLTNDPYVHWEGWPDDRFIKYVRLQLTSKVDFVYNLVDSWYHRRGNTYIHSTSNLRTSRQTAQATWLTQVKQCGQPLLVWVSSLWVSLLTWYITEVFTTQRGPQPSSPLFFSERWTVRCGIVSSSRHL